MAAGLAALLLGCAAFAEREARRELDEAKAAVERRDLPAAWAELSGIRRRHPDSAAAREAFPLAAAVFQRLYFRERLDRHSTWMQTEPAFMLDWFASFFAGDAFPEVQARALFVGMPYGYFQEYLALAATRPALARFDTSAREDNGIIEGVDARLH